MYLYRERRSMTNDSLDECLRLVADRHRRRVIYHLRHEANGTTTFEDLVDQVHRHASGGKNGPPPDREALAIRLQHSHLPKLADHGVVDYDHRSGAVRYYPDEQVEAVLDSLSEDVSLPIQ